MEALGQNISNTKDGANLAASVSGTSGKTLFGNDVGVAEQAEFANLLDILGGKKKESTNLLDILNAAKENPDALADLPKEALDFIGEKFRFDGKAILNDSGTPVQAEDIIAKIKELKPELLKAGNSELAATPEAKDVAKKNEAIEVRNLLKSHELGLGNKTKASSFILNSGDDFVQTKTSLQSTAMSGEMLKKSGIKNNSGLGQYSKEAKNLETSLISSQGQVAMPEAAVGMSKFKGSDSNMNQLSAQTKVVDLSNVQANNRSQLIDQVSKMIEQNNIKSSDKMDVFVKHDELGNFKIQVSKGAQADQLNLKIISSERAGHNFFVENEAQLVKTLNQNGIKFGNIKIALSGDNLFSSQSEGGKDSSESFSQNRGQESQSSKQNNSESADSERRKQLWQAFKENAEYASA